MDKFKVFLLFVVFVIGVSLWSCSMDRCFFVFSGNEYLSNRGNDSLIPENEEDNFYQVVRVIDGDTIEVYVGGETRKVRIIGLDTPEFYPEEECYAREATLEARRVLADKRIILEADKSQGNEDKYGRLLRFVILPEGRNFAEYMIENGFAKEYTFIKLYKYQAEFIKAEEVARKNKLGLWGECKN